MYRSARSSIEDAKLGFCILAPAHKGTKDSHPHDHGPSWASYGQARGETEMTDWELVEQASADKPGKVRYVKIFVLKPDMACAYNVGDLHSLRRAGPMRLIRIEGRNMEKVSHLSYERV